jgi:hypothetical protein
LLDDLGLPDLLLDVKAMKKATSNIEKFVVAPPDSEVDEEGGGHDELSSNMWHVIVNNIKKETVVGEKGAMKSVWSFSNRGPLPARRRRTRVMVMRPTKTMKPRHPIPRSVHQILISHKYTNFDSHLLPPKRWSFSLRSPSPKRRV